MVYWVCQFISFVDISTAGTSADFSIKLLFASISYLNSKTVDKRI
uniref:Uncharacterized protein n=1 Tax=uncultured bacterium contig00081 TaxID=1181557 RepID=A0A806K0K3_9BACT|nr:hypothetical protein [uncultured bacterium contig00081]